MWSKRESNNRMDGRGKAVAKSCRTSRIEFKITSRLRWDNGIPCTTMLRNKLILSKRYFFIKKILKHLNLWERDERHSIKGIISKKIPWNTFG